MVDIPDEPLELSGVRNFRWPTQKGAMVLDVVPNGPLDEAGVGVADIVFDVGGTRVESAAEALDVIRNLKVGEETDVRFYHSTTAKGRMRWSRKRVKADVVSYGRMLSALFPKSIDKATGAVSYYPVSRDRTKLGRKTTMCGWVSEAGGKAIPMMYLEYFANDWLFIEQAIFVTDGPGRFPVEFDRRMERDNKGGRIWEWGSAPGGKGTDVDAAIKAISTANVTSVVLMGDTYRKEITPSREDLQLLIYAQQFATMKNMKN